MPLVGLGAKGLFRFEAAIHEYVSHLFGGLLQ